MQNAILSGESLKEQILKFHGQSVKNGFYDDYPTQESRQTEEYICSRAMLISGEIAEAYEAHRAGKVDVENSTLHALMGVVQKQGLAAFAADYKKYVKGTVAEELADTYIRLCCVAGSVKIYDAPDLVEELAILNDYYKDSSIHACFLRASQSAAFSCYRPIYTSDISQGLAAVYFLANKLQIDLHRHVELKHIYNTTREYKHGKNY